MVIKPTIQTYAKLFKKVEAEGIEVIQLSISSYRLTATLHRRRPGRSGEETATTPVTALRANRTRSAIVHGPTASALSAYKLKDIKPIKDTQSAIQVVSALAADWDAAEANGIVHTVLRQSPGSGFAKRALWKTCIFHWQPILFSTSTKSASRLELTLRVLL